jgi:hypothetical protein
MRYYVLSVILFTYAFVWVLCAAIDRGHCLAHGVAYGGTNVGLNGWCEVGGVRVPAEAIGRQ